jgi:hypothetical protein
MPERHRALAKGIHRRGSRAMPRITINPKISVSVVFVAAMFMNIMDIIRTLVALPFKQLARDYAVAVDICGSCGLVEVTSFTLRRFQVFSACGEGPFNLSSVQRYEGDASEINCQECRLWLD